MSLNKNYTTSLSHVKRPTFIKILFLGAFIFSFSKKWGEDVYRMWHLRLSPKMKEIVPQNLVVYPIFLMWFSIFLLLNASMPVFHILNVYFSLNHFFTLLYFYFSHSIHIFRAHNICMRKVILLGLKLPIFLLFPSSNNLEKGVSGVARGWRNIMETLYDIQ